MRNHNHPEQLQLPLEGNYLSWLDSVGEHLDDYEQINRILRQKKRVKSIRSPIFEQLAKNGY